MLSGDIQHLKSSILLNLGKTRHITIENTDEEAELLLVYHHGQDFLPVCSDEWTEQLNDLVCKQLHRQ